MALDVSTQMRLTGMASGLDTDAIIQNLGRVNTLRVDAVKRDRQFALWKQESLRSTINMINSFQRSNLNMANPSSNFRSASAFAKFTYSISAGAGASEASKAKAAGAVSVVANGDLKNFNQSVQAIAQLASRDTWSGDALGLRGVTTSGFDMGKMASSGSAAIFGVSIDGVSRTVTVSNKDMMDIAVKHSTQFEAGYNTLSDAIASGDSVNLDSHFVRVDGNAVSLRQYFESEGVDVSGATNLDDLDIGDGDVVDAAVAKISGSMVLRQNADYDASGKKQAQAFADIINTELKRLFGSDYSNVAKVTGKGELSFDKSGSTVTLFEPFTTGTLALMGTETGATNGNISKKALSDVFGKDFFFAGYAQKADNSGPDENKPILTTRTIQINGVSLTVNPDDTINSLVSKINSSEAGVNLNYNSASDKFTLTSVNEGTASNIQNVRDATAQLFGMLGLGTAVEVSRTDSGGQPVSGHVLSIGGKFSLASDESVKAGGSYQGSDATLAALGPGTLTQRDGKFVFFEDTDANTPIDLTDEQAKELAGIGSVGSRSEGTNLIAVINGAEFTRQSNTFMYEGMTYTFNDTYNVVAAEPGKGTISAGGGMFSIGNEAEIKIEVGKNTAEISASIKTFVDEYNKIIDEINYQLSSKRDRDYRPLSDDEKKSMSAEDIKAYEDKAKVGMLANDTDLRKLLDQMRSAMYQKVEGVGLTMSDIGITTSANWKDGGRLVIDESKLNAALENRYDEVVTLFTKTSDISAGDVANKGKRSAESGIAQRLNDVLNDAVRTTRDNSNNKGYLIEKSGIQNDASQSDNAIQKQINQYDKRISDLLDRWYRQENAYYQMFARMETAMSKMQSQQNSLASILGNQG